MNSQKRLDRLERNFGKSVVKHGLAFLRSIDLDYRLDDSLGEHSKDIMRSLQKLVVNSVGKEAGLRSFEQARRDASVEDIDTIEDFFGVWNGLLKNVRVMAGNTGLVVLSQTMQSGSVASPIVPSIVRCQARCIPDLRRDIEVANLSWEPCQFALTEKEIRLLSEAGASMIPLDKIYEIDRSISFIPPAPDRILPIDFFGDAGQALVTVVAGPLHEMELAKESMMALTALEIKPLHARDDERILLSLYNGVRDPDVMSFILDISPKELREGILRLQHATYIDHDLNLTVKGSQYAVRIGKL